MTQQKIYKEILNMEIPKITLEWLENNEACSLAIDAYKELPVKGRRDLFHLLSLMMESGETEHLKWANWLIVRCMSREQQLKYAIHAAESVLEIYEKIIPGDDRPRKAIETTKAVLQNDTPENRAAAEAAAGAASWAAARAAGAAAWAAAGAAAGAAEEAAWAASWAAARAARAAWAASWAAARAARAAWAAARAAEAAAEATTNNEWKEKMLDYLNYGIDLLKGGKE